MLLMYNYVLLKMSTWYSKHVEEINSILRINNIQCIVGNYCMVSSCLSVSLTVRVKQLVCQWTDFCDVLYWGILLHLCRENSDRLVSDKNIRHFRCDLVLLLRETPLHTNTATYVHQTARGKFRPRQTRQLPRAVDLKGRLPSCQSY